MRKLETARCKVCNKEFLKKDRAYKDTCSVDCGMLLARAFCTVIRFAEYRRALVEISRKARDEALDIARRISVINRGKDRYEYLSRLEG